MKRRVKLRHRRLARALQQSRRSQNGWALRLGISKAYLSQLLSGQRRHPGPATRRRLLEATGLDFDDLFKVGVESESGIPPVRARTLAEFRSGGYRLRLERLVDRPAQREGDSMLLNWWRELRLSARTLARSPAFAIVTIAILAVGIGANSAIFSVVNHVLLQPLPYPDSDRIVRLWQTKSGQTTSVSPANYVDWKAQSRSFAAMGAYATSRVVLTGGGEPEPVAAALAAPGFFEALGVAPQLGQIFTRPPQAAPDPVVVLSHGLWMRRFGGDPGIVGSQVTLDGQVVKVVAVMPVGFGFPLNAQLWKPLVFDFDVSGSRGAQYLGVVARLPSSGSLEEVQTELDVIAARLANAHAQNRDVGIRAVGLQEDLAAASRPTLLVLQGAVALTLLIACANVANLLLARATSRRRELAVRSALGASRGRLLQHLMTESLLIAAAGAATGLLLAITALPLLVSVLPASPLIDGVQLDRHVLLFTVATAAAASLLFGLAPAFHWSRRSRQGGLAFSGREMTAARSYTRLRSGLVIAEVAIAVTLVVGAGLLLQTFWKLLAVDPGFDPTETIAMRVGLPTSRYDEAEARQFFEQLLAGVTSLPDVESTGLVAFLPLGGSWTFSFDIQGRPPFRAGDKPSGAFRPVGGDYFRTLGIPLLEGRVFQPDDRPTQPPVVVVNETLARRFFPAGNAIGSKLVIGYGSGELVPREIVGVVSDIKQWGLSAPAPPGFYLPHSQVPFRQMYLVARATSQPDLLVPLLKEQVWELDSELAISGIETLGDRLTRSVGVQRARLWLVGAFATVALLLALFGIYGLISYTVHQRLGEVGLRMAMGADRVDILGLFLASGVTLAATGIAVGLAAALGLTRVLETMLFDTSPTDPVTLAAVAALVMATAVAACYVPARRALRADPVRMLRAE